LKAGTKGQPPTAASYPGGRWKERAMFLIVLVVIVAVVMIVAVPRILRKR
jgi:t-SNARE complex subunit (syntaxin)